MKINMEAHRRIWPLDRLIPKEVLGVFSANVSGSIAGDQFRPNPNPDTI